MDHELIEVALKPFVVPDSLQRVVHADFGSEGTLEAPKLYYIITGSTGVFLPRFTNKEVGVREVLFKDQTLFQVNRITHYANRWTIPAAAHQTAQAHAPAADVIRSAPHVIQRAPCILHAPRRARPNHRPP